MEGRLRASRGNGQPHQQDSRLPLTNPWLVRSAVVELISLVPSPDVGPHFEAFSRLVDGRSSLGHRADAALAIVCGATGRRERFLHSYGCALPLAAPPLPTTASTSTCPQALFRTTAPIKHGLIGMFAPGDRPKSGVKAPTRCADRGECGERCAEMRYAICRQDIGGARARTSRSLTSSSPRTGPSPSTRGRSRRPSS